MALLVTKSQSTDPGYLG